MNEQRIKVTIPKKLQFLFTPSRYKVARGGRGSGKSWSFCARLAYPWYLKEIAYPLHKREIQNSIKQSVHSLLADQIQLD